MFNSASPIYAFNVRRLEKFWTYVRVCALLSPSLTLTCVRGGNMEPSKSVSNDSQ